MQPANTQAPATIKNKPVAIRLSPQELGQITSLAMAEQRTLSNMCRLLLSRGLAQHQSNAKAA
ncbi:MAG: hypothetical protein K2X51_12570 [Burkholderiales bacterium]|nr:hypothetical protein [Burkholderiales bacterium]